jgi:hypothetical protein
MWHSQSASRVVPGDEFRSLRFPKLERQRIIDRFHAICDHSTARITRDVVLSQPELCHHPVLSLAYDFAEAKSLKVQAQAKKQHRDEGNRESTEATAGPFAGLTLKEFLEFLDPFSIRASTEQKAQCQYLSLPKQCVQEQCRFA